MGTESVLRTLRKQDAKKAGCCSNSENVDADEIGKRRKSLELYMLGSSKLKWKINLTKKPKSGWKKQLIFCKPGFSGKSTTTTLCNWAKKVNRTDGGCSDLSADSHGNSSVKMSIGALVPLSCTFADIVSETAEGKKRPCWREEERYKVQNAYNKEANARSHTSTHTCKNNINNWTEANKTYFRFVWFSNWCAIDQKHFAKVKSRTSDKKPE